MAEATTDGLSAPGTSSYDSNTMSVGDGTWDSSRNDFLLPNLQGLNFATMQYNGMGNRFRGLPEYHSLVLGHGVVAAITFLVIVPAAIFIARFYHSSGRAAYKWHVYLQILTVFLATVVLVLGWFAVGPERSLTNPHHGIGVAIYVLVLVQFLYGWWMSRRERKRKTAHPTIPLKVHIHRIFGRAVATLAFVQVALGLTLYGSPKVLFILYALWGALLIFAYLTLEYRNKPRFGPGGPLPGPRSDYPSDYYSDYTSSYLTGSRTDITRDRRRAREDESSGWGKKLLAGAGALGAYEWWKRRREHKEIVEEKESEYDSRADRRNDRRPGPPGPSVYSEATSVGPPGQYGRPGTPGRRQPSRPPPPAQYAGQQTPTRPRHDGTEMSPQTWEDDEIENEKYGDRPQGNTWRDRVVEGVAGIAAFQGVKSLFGSKKKRKDGYVDSDVSYRPPPQGGNQSMVSQTDVSRVEAGQAPFSPNDQRPNRRVHMADSQPMTPTRPPNRSRTSVDSLDYSESTNFAPPRRQATAEGPNLRDSIATMGAIAGLRDWNQRRKNRKEDERLEKVRKQELQHEESFNRRNSDRYPRPQDASGRRQSFSDTILTGPTGQDPTLGGSRQSIRPPDTSHPPLPAGAGSLPYGSGAPDQYHGEQQQQPPQPPYHQPYQPPLQQQQQQQVMFDLPPPPPGPPPNAARPLEYQPPPPGSLQMPQGTMNPDPSRLVGDQGQNQNQASSNFPADLAAAGGVAAGLAAGQHQRTQSESPSRRGARGESRTRYGARENRRASTASASVSQINSGSGAVPQGSPPVSVKVNMHPDGRHVTLRRLNEDEAAAERAARKRGEKKSRRNSSLSSGIDNDDGGRYRRHGAGQRRDSSRQPITNVPPPPAMSNVGMRRDSELNLPPVPPGHSSQVLSQATGPAGSGAVNSPPGTANQGGTDLGTGTDLSNFDNNRRRRRAERARRMEAARGGSKGVEFS